MAGPIRMLALALVAAGCATALADSRAGDPGNGNSGNEGWHRVESSGLLLFGDGDPGTLQQLAEELTAFDATFAHVAGWPSTGDRPFRVFVIRDSDLARRLGLGDGIAGWAFTTLSGGIAAVLDRGDRSSTRTTVFHEYTHVLLRRNRRAPLPPWFDEGLASFFGTVHFRSGTVVVGAPPRTAVRRLAARGPLPLEELFGGQIRNRPAEGIADYYATAWALSHYLLLDPKGRREMAGMVDRMSRGVKHEDARRAAFGRSADALEAELRRHVALLTRGVPAEVLFDVKTLTAEAPIPPAPTSLTREDVTCALGDLALEIDRLGQDARVRKLAEELLRKSNVGSDADPRCLAALAELHARMGDATRARQKLEPALARSAEDPRIRIHAGRLELAVAESEGGAVAARDFSAAASHFRRALDTGGDSPAAWFGLGRCLAGLGDADAAIDAFERARGLGWSPRLDLALAELVLARGDVERAVELLRPIAHDPHGGGVGERASQLLREAGLMPADEIGR